MKKTLTLLFITISSIVYTQNENALKWETKLDQAINKAVSENKTMMLFFTGSDWCGWCMRLQKEVFVKPEFKNWADKNVVLVELDFPRRTAQDPKISQQNRELAQMFQVRGYPTVWFVEPEISDSNQINLKKIGYQGYLAGGPVAWTTSANKFLLNK
ncbi:MAG: thioredoxin family protein [Crocinitomicaceae bacterium]|nr:thioredoxin family protein [Crocinitomicaceae bacterium]